MKKVIIALVLAVGVFGASLQAAPLGLLYTSAKEPAHITSNSNWSKKASGTIHSVLGAVSLGNASVEKLARKAGITKIHHVDKKTTRVFYFAYVSETFTVYGE